ncbi:hypothetical protein EWB00_000428, partial [Schistosoma japonicum]
TGIPVCEVSGYVWQTLPGLFAKFSKGHQPPFYSHRKQMKSFCQPFPGAAWHVKGSYLDRGSQHRPVTHPFWCLA